MLLFTFFWSIQTAAVYQFSGAWWSIGYFASVLIAAPFALRIRGEYKLIRENLRTFFLFLRRKQLRNHLANKRREIEVELAKLVRIVKRLPSVKV